MSTLPKGIQFKTVKPQGFYQEYRDYIVTPVQTYTNQFSVYDIVRIQFNLQDWYIDPYESYIEAEVRLADETTYAANTASSISSTGDTQIKFYMMDGPSTSLINDFRFEVNSKEIERIREYDQIGNLLTDLNVYPDVVDQKDFEGYYSNRGQKTYTQVNNSYNQSHPQPSTTASTTQYIARGGTNQNLFFVPGVHQAQSANSDPYSILATAIDPISIATNNYEYSALATTPMDYDSGVGYTGARLNFYSPYHALFNVTDGRFVDPTIGKAYSYDCFMGQLTSGNSNYGITHMDYVHPASSYNLMGKLPVDVSPKLSQIDGHNIFLTNLPTSKIVNGKFQTQIYNQASSTAQTRAYMQIPLLSGVMGVLIPQERWQLIPSSSLGQVNMEFRFNPNAFFSHNGTQPNWVVGKFQLRLRMYRFDQNLMGQLKSQVQQGIQMHSQSFSMGPIYNVQPNVSVTNNWQLNNGIPSIKQLFFWFLSDDYQTYWHARKNYRVSQNVTSMQLKIGGNYIPQTPILGHAGNIIMNSQLQQDNSVYLSELQQALNSLFDCKRHMNINKLNFAINERPYDVTLGTFLGTTSNSAVNGFSTPKRNFLINSGYTLYNELRCRGKALYAFNIEMDKKNDDTMTGIDTTKVRPIELILKSDDPNTYPRNSTMYVSFLNDFIVSFGAMETSTEGSG